LQKNSKHYSRFITKLRKNVEKEPVTIILSPHIDDVLLSLSSMIESGKLGNNILAVNVFTITDSSTNTVDKSDFAAVSKTSIARIKEEIKFADYLAVKKINYMPVLLGLKDAAIDAYYTHVASRSINKLPSLTLQKLAKYFQNDLVRARIKKLNLKELLDSIIAQYKVNAVIATIGIGDHFDHVALRAYVNGLDEKIRIGLYADIPYVYDYKINSPNKLRQFVPANFINYDKRIFDPAQKNKLFNSIYKSQHDPKMLKELEWISKGLGETVFWNR